MRTETTTPQAQKPYKIGDEKCVLYRVPGSPYAVGERVSIMSVSNTGTRKSPVWRYYVRGAWYDHEALGTESPLD